MNTETNVPKMPETLQEYFNIAWQKFVVEKSPRSASEAGMCYYRYPGDPPRRCAIGHAIPDELYKPEMEGLSAHEIIAKHTSGNPIAGLDGLQCCHDNADPSNFHADIKMRLEAFAQIKNLTIPEVSA